MSEHPSRWEQRLRKHVSPSFDMLTSRPERDSDKPLRENCVVPCGWGRLIMGQTFRSAQDLAAVLLDETAGRRDIALYVRDPHIVLSYAPQSLFLDPSDTYRLWLSSYRAAPALPRGFILRRIQTLEDAHAVNELYLKRGMVPTDIELIHQERYARSHVFLVAEDSQTGAIIGTVMGVNHEEAFNDPDRGSSMWCLAVDPQTPHSGVGECLVRRIAEHFQTRGLQYMDLSVLHDNQGAIRLYEKLGFTRIQTFAVKNKNAINEALFLGPQPALGLNPYGRIIVDEARARGILVNLIDAEAGYFELTSGARSIICRESLSELTSAVAMSRCQNKHVTHKLLRQAGLRTPACQLAGDVEADLAFLRKHGALVVKPDNGEQGEGVSVDIRTAEELQAAIAAARDCGGQVLLESFHPGQDLRVVVIGYEVVAAAIRKPAEVVGDGVQDIRTLIAKQSRRREAATGGESRIVVDADTESCLRAAGYALDTVLPPGEILVVKRAANLHKGGTIHDVTDELHPLLQEAAVRAAQALKIPVVGLDFMVPDAVQADAAQPSAAQPNAAQPNAAQPEYVIIEANERPGLANHEPRPTAQKFIDLLFPHSAHSYQPLPSGAKTGAHSYQQPPGSQAHREAQHAVMNSDARAAGEQPIDDAPLAGTWQKQFAQDAGTKDKPQEGTTTS